MNQDTFRIIVNGNKYDVKVEKKYFDIKPVDKDSPKEREFIARMIVSGHPSLQASATNQNVKRFTDVLFKRL